MLKTNFFEAKEKHTFHLVDSSQLPFWTSFSAMWFLYSVVCYWHKSEPISGSDTLLLQLSFIALSSTLYIWFFRVTQESGQGHHTQAVRQGLRYGMALFIISEILFFVAFFWAFFHVSLSPSIAIGCVWPPKSIQPLDIWGLPLVNTLLLLSSGVTITLAHHAILQADNYSYHQKFAKHLLVTIILGTTFLICQGIEYKYGITFSWKENIYGTTFFVTTGFHGLHVTIGTIFLLFCLVREIITSMPLITRQPLLAYRRFKYAVHYLANPGINIDWIKTKVNDHDYSSTLKSIHLIQNYLTKYGFSKDQHFGFEAAAWYWHFVDVVWIFLFLTIYWWGS